MKNTTKSGWVLTGALACLLLPSASFSQSGVDFTAVVNALTAIRSSIDAAIYTAANYIFQTPPNLANAVTANAAATTAGQNISSVVKGFNDSDLQQGLTPDAKTLNAKMTEMTSLQASDSVVPSVLVGGLPVPFYSQSVQSSMTSSLTQGNENFNYQALITPLAYSTTSATNSGTMGFTQDNAMNFIKTISGYAIPLSTINLNTYSESQLSAKQKQDIQNSANYQQYTVQRRQLLAEQTAALTILYDIYARRQPNTNIKMTDTPIPPDPNNPNANPSAAQIEDYIATARTNSANSPTWYAQMATASPTNVNREILFVLAEIQAELHAIHLINEQQLAMNAINLLGAVQTGKTTLALQASKVQSDINDKMKGNAQAGTTQQTPPSATGQTPQTQQNVQQLQQVRQGSQAQQPGNQPTQ